jgi:hypothetical protein
MNRHFFITAVILLSAVTAGLAAGNKQKQFEGLVIRFDQASVEVKRGRSEKTFSLNSSTVIEPAAARAEKKPAVKKDRAAAKSPEKKNGEKAGEKKDADRAAAEEMKDAGEPVETAALALCQKVRVFYSSDIKGAVAEKIIILKKGYCGK